MSKIEQATRWMEQAANDDSHGYDQTYRWGERGDYDCSAAVITAWEEAGVPVKSNGASYTGNMYKPFINCGFVDVTNDINLSNGAGLVRGDVLLTSGKHTAMYIGGGREVEASINEKGKATGGAPGDQTGREFLIRSYRNYPWKTVLRYVGDDSSYEPQPTPVVDEGAAARTRAVIALGQEHSINFTGHNIAVDGIPGDETCRQRARVLQHAMNLDYGNSIAEDGAFGTKSKSKLGNHYVRKGEIQFMVTALKILLLLKGYDIGTVGCPELFEDNLEGAVRQYQEDAGLTVDGVAGRNTFLSLVS